MTYLVWALLILAPLLLAGLSRAGGAVAGTSGARRTTWLWVAGVVGFAALMIAPHLVTYSQQELLVFLVINILIVASYRLLTLTGEFSLAHVVIVGDHGQLVTGHIVVTPKHEVAKVHASGERLRPEAVVFKSDRLDAWHTKTPINPFRFAGLKSGSLAKRRALATVARFLPTLVATSSCVRSN